MVIWCSRMKLQEADISYKEYPGVRPKFEVYQIVYEVENCERV